ncbi:putative bifunctional diguanylate cyclase/phosphodiesterase [Pseudomonas sp.]|uniref:putative bifunctional diguanylate cyclase/phosphodiesterase n=1 Tax=Pseudomonas sp. TaxID=306 RepID=UPI002FC5F3B2
MHDPLLATGHRTTRYSRCTYLLLGSLTLLLLSIWLLPQSAELKQSHGWFPTWLHTTTEFFAIVVAMLVFSVTWHSYRVERAGNLLILACGFLAVGLLDFAHVLSYRGMPNFITPASPEKAIDFWLAARLSAAICLLIVALRPWTALRKATTRYYLLAAALLVTALFSYLQLWHPALFPRTFIDGVGLTPLKIIVEWLVISVLIAAALCFWRDSRRAHAYDARGLFLAVALSILSELCFTAYSNVNDIYSLLGHLYKVLSYWFIYRVVFISSVREPYLRLAAEVSERQAAEQKIETLAFYDTLTGLPNLELLRDRTNQSLAANHRNHKHVALLFMDIDAFKTVNDSLGHSYGDALLVALAERLRLLLRHSDTLCRPGGDEFLILLPDLESADDAAAIAQKIMALQRQPFSLFGRTISSSLSLGVAVAPSDGDCFESLRRNAETAMYKAKQTGRQTWRFFDATMNSEALEHLNLLNGLRQAIEGDELLLHYQPQIDLRDGTLIGVEALVRWQHPEWGLVAPGRFIPAAEESRLIVPMGEWILQHACAQAAAWHRAGLVIPQIAVNLSAIQLQHGNVERLVLQALASSQLPAHMLELEITESSLLDNTAQVLETLKRIKAMGVRLSIDDFGTGYSSLAYLRNLAVDKLKIDQSFVRDLTTGSDSRAIITAIVQMARSLGLETIAEGVEDAPTANALYRLGCLQAQGYLYARPLPAEQLAQFVREQIPLPCAVLNHELSV